MYDAIIVGARCAGSALGLLLARRGYRVLLVDRDTFPSDMPMSSHFVHQRGVACLARWGLRDQSSPPTARRWPVSPSMLALHPRRHGATRRW